MPYPTLYLTVRVPGDPNTALPVVKRELAAIDRSIALGSIRPMSDVTSDSLARQRFSMILLTAFAAVALSLAFVGLYGVIALGIAQRRRELGVRMALGASPRDLLGLVVGEGARVTAFGIAAGVAGALALTRVLRSLVYDVSVNDPLTLVIAAAAVAAVALLATYIPARQVARAAPTDALRLE
jgi:ABC-type antimicrobial peptide transport system permease subunit